MLCRKYIGLFTSFCLLFLFSLLFSSPVLAVNDLSVTYSSNTVLPWNEPLFPTCQNRACFSDYKYLIIETTPTNPSMNSYIGFRFSYSNYTADYKCYPLGLCIFTLTNGTNSTDMIGWRGSSTTVPYDFTAKLVNELPSESQCPEGPSGTINITENGTVDVSDYATANVNVPQNTDAPYNNKLDDIKKAIYVCAGTALVIYFFYCIYRMIIKGSGVR